ncbi:BT_3928 family protein [Croceiramulus getboli]|nr:DoxX family membrane protein [Flavobacteriaceae bacterium YJPT1-3]
MNLKQISVGVIRIVVGVLFIISGMVKLNDPLGFSYKLQEYFSAPVLNIEWLSPFALGLAIILVVVEVVLGIALIIGYLRKLTLWLLLLMIAFFTFLTFYSAYFNKVTDCGCFGDALPLDPWESFAKDVVLLILILFLLFNQKHIQPFFNKGVRSVLILVSFLACLSFGYYVLMHLPVWDFRPYKVGVNIPEASSIPEGAPEAVFEYEWVFKVDGAEKTIITNGSYPEVPNGEFIEVNTQEISPGYVPPIHDFSIERGEKDFTQQMMEEDHLLIVVAYNLANTELEGYYGLRQRTEEALRKGYKVIGLTASDPATIARFIREQKLHFDFYFTDETVLKTIVRSSPGILKLQQGTIQQKLHWNDLEQLNLETLASAQPKLDFTLKRKLDSIQVLDQQYRILMQIEGEEARKERAVDMGLDPMEASGDLWRKQMLLDSTNMQFVDRVMKNRGYPGKDLVGTPTNTVAWYVIQHNPEYIPKYLDTIRQAAQQDQLPMRLVAMMEDRYLMGEGKAQRFGTQGSVLPDGTEFIWPIQDPEQVNERRKEVGFDQTIEAYAKSLFGEDFEYEVLTLEEAEALRKQDLTNQDD